MKQFDKDELIRAVFGFVAIFLLYCFACYLTYKEQHSY